MRYLSFDTTDTTVANVQRRNGLLTAPERERKNDSRHCIQTNFADLAAIDYIDFEVPCSHANATTKVRALYAMRLDSREIELFGVETWSNGLCATNCMKWACDPVIGFLKDKSAVIMDRDHTYVDPFMNVITMEGKGARKISPRSPNLSFPFA